jgi:hypothetical protein
VRGLGFIVAPLAVFGSLACGQTSDPAVPCERIELGEAQPGTVAALADSPVMAISDAPRPYVVHPVCTGDEGCRLVRTYLESDTADADDDALPGGSALLLTSTGRYVVAIDRRKADPKLRSWAINPSAEDPVTVVRNDVLGPGDARALVVGMRDSDTIVVRNDALELGTIQPDQPTFQPIAPNRPEMKVVAVGNDYIVGREIIDGERERIVLVPVTREAQDFFGGPIDLATLPTLSRVEITGDDDHVVATAGDGDDAETFVFSIPDGVLVDRFLGGAVPGPLRLDALPGLRATSPDGTHLAYRTSSGALALRDLQESSSCLVRSATGGDHRVAGFAADAMLYMQADYDLGESHVFAFDTHARRLTALDPGDRGHHLVGAPPRLDNRTRPWAIGVRDGSYAALQPDAPAESLGLQGPVFVPRGDDESALWLADRYEDDKNDTRFGLRRFVPRFDGRTFDFTVADEPESVPDVFASSTSDNPLAPGLSRLTPGERPCLSTGAPGGWAYQCGSSNAREGFLANAPLPTTEGSSNLLDPEVSDPIEGE